MGVLAGRIGKFEEGLWERGRNKLVGLVNRFVEAVENFGFAVIDREVDARKEFRQ